jgi:hypothetical protein
MEPGNEAGHWKLLLVPNAYGLRWFLLSTWQGWAVYVTYVAGLIGGRYIVFAPLKRLNVN